MESSEKLLKLEEAIKRIEDRSNKIMFFCPDMKNTPSGGIGVLYQHVKVLKELGYNVMVVHEKDDYTKPEWLGEAYTSLPHQSLQDGKFNVGMEDLFIIPEGHTNIMEQVKNMPFKKIILCQSYLYVLGSLVPAMRWSDFGIKDVIVVTSTLETYLKDVFGEKNLDIKICRPSISKDLFKPSTTPKKPIVAISSRDQHDMLNVIKHFYLKFPQYKWVTFRDMRNMTRDEFQSTLAESCVGVWIDKVAGFGTFPIECARTNTPFIATIPNIVPEYISEKLGVWAQNELELPNLIASYISKWLSDELPTSLYEGLAELEGKYTEEEEKTSIETIYGAYVAELRSSIEEYVEQIKNKVE